MAEQTQGQLVHGLSQLERLAEGAAQGAVERLIEEAYHAAGRWIVEGDRLVAV